MTKGDVSGNGLIRARFSCDSHGDILFPAGEKVFPLLPGLRCHRPWPSVVLPALEQQRAKPREGRSCSNPLYVEHFIPLLGVEYFPFPCFNALLLCASGSGEKGQERALFSFQRWQSLSPLLGERSKKPQHRGQRVSSAFTKGITPWPVIPLVEAVGITEGKRKPDTNAKHATQRKRN